MIDLKGNQILYSKTKNIFILLFYKFQEIKNLEYFARKQKSLCKKIGVLGKILVAKEGINGSVSGTKKQTEKYKRFLCSQNGFEDIWFKEETAFENPFKKMHVRVKDEIVALKKPINIKNKGEPLTPKQFLELYEFNEEGVIILDARNYYEYDLGRFKNALNPKIKTFREFPKFVEKFKKQIKNKNKKIVMYCTGGIRCEKASAYMVEQGFKNIFQLEGGIINFCQQFPDTVWEGKCFVFDKRLMSDLNQNNKPITKCINCNELCDLYRNCKNADCDKLVIMCIKCQEKLHGCCSKNCLIKFKKYANERAIQKRFGIWKPKEVLQNYNK